MNFIKNTAPDNLEAIDWLNQNVSGQPHIIEAQGDSYTTFNQVSASTGLPTIQGWLVHEWLWRGGYEAPAARQQEVDTIYRYLSGQEDSELNIDQVKNILSRYQVKYIFIGDKEWEKYPDINLSILDNLNAKEVFRSGQTHIFELP